MSRVFLALFWRPRTFFDGGDVIIKNPQGGTIEQGKITPTEEETLVMLS